MLQAGILREDERLELIEGELVQMTPIGPQHARCVNRLARFFNKQLDQVIVSVQNPVHISEYSEPQPDLMLLRPHVNDYGQVHPTPEDVLLVIEVADATVGLDRDVKLSLYARAGIAEAWLVSLQDRWIEVYTEPSPAGYLTMRKVLPGSALSPQAFPAISLAVSDIIE